MSFENFCVDAACLGEELVYPSANPMQTCPAYIYEASRRKSGADKVLVNCWKLMSRDARSEALLALLTASSMTSFIERYILQIEICRREV